MTHKPAVYIKPLTKEIVLDNIGVLMEMSKQLQGDYWTLEHYLSEMNRKWELSSATYSDGKLCGFIIVSEKPESLHVHRIVISEEFQGYGIGKMLINKTVKDVQECRKGAVTLKAEADNARTINFYKQLNFEMVGEKGALVLMTLNVVL